MRRPIIALASFALLATASVSPAAADTTASIGGATATAVGSWVKPTGCSQFPVTYSGLPAGTSAWIHVLDAVTRTDVGSVLVMSGDPRAGRQNVQVCGFKTEDTASLVLSLAVSGAGAADSTTFAFAARPNTVRCVNKANYTIKEFSGKACPKGWVKR